MRPRRNALVALPSLLGSLALVAACQKPPSAPSIGAPIPELELSDLQGRAFHLSDVRGKVLLINFWASWCPPCVEEMPSLERLYRTLQDKGLEVVAVSVDDSPEIIERFRQEHELSFTILHDPGAKVSHRFQTFKYPETYIVDRQGNLVSKIIGPRDWIAPGVLLDIVALLKEGAPASGARAAQSP